MQQFPTHVACFRAVTQHNFPLPPSVPTQPHPDALLGSISGSIGWLGYNLPIFSELYYWPRIGNGFISLSCPVFALSTNMICICHTQRQFSVLYPADVLHGVRTHHGHIRGGLWRLQASAGTRWLVRLTQLHHLVLCHLAPLWHLLDIEQCPIWSPVWLFLCLIVMVDMANSLETHIHWGYHHQTEMQHATSRKGCGHFSVMLQVNYIRRLALVWRIEQVTSGICFVLSTSRSFTKLPHSWPHRASIRYTLSITDLSTMSRVSRTGSSLLVSRNGLPYSPIADVSDITSCRNIFYTPGKWSQWLKSGVHSAQSTHLSLMTRAISGPLTIHLYTTAGYLV